MLAAILVAANLALSPGAHPGQSILVPLDTPEHPPAGRSSPIAPAKSIPPGRDGIASVANVRVNNPALLTGPAADVTPAIAVNGNKVLVVWYVRGSLVTQRLRAAWSEDGGATFTDAGWLPNFVTWRWGVDPCVEVDSFDGTFLVSAQVTDPTVPATGIGIVTAQINGGITWGPVSVTNATAYLGVLFGDQLHAHFDVNNFTWHLAFDDAYASPPALIHRYSADHGATWFQPDTVVTDASGHVGVTPRIAFLPDRGPIVAHNSTPNGSWFDPNSIRTSAFLWPSFPPPVPVSTHRIDAGSLPGTRDVVSAQTIAVNRTPHIYSGRAYLAWVQSATLSWPTPAPASLPETEPNDTPATANALGGLTGYLDGAMASNSDADVYSLSLAAGEHLVLTVGFIQSLGVNANCRTEVIAADGTHALQFTGFLPGDAGVGRALFTAPRAGTYFVRITGFEVGSYFFSLARSNQTPSPARDQRELVTSYSDDAGGSWSSPAVLPIGAPGFDVGMPTLVVANDGRPYLFWLDYSKTDPDGAIATLEVTRSTDGGATWDTPRTISTVPSDWQPVTVTAGSNSKMGWRIDAATTPIPLGPGPNAAHESGRPAGAPSPSDEVHVVWPDARDGESNIYTAHFPTGFNVPFAVSDTTAVPGQYVELRMVLCNRNSLFPELITPTFVLLGRNWAHSYSAPFSLDESETRVVYPFAVQVPDTAAPGPVSYLGGIQIGGEFVGGCSTVINVQSTVGVEQGLPREVAFDAPTPNPALTSAGFRFAIPAPSDVSLEVFDIAGARVRSLASGTLTAGPHTRAWDLRDDAGHRVAPGVYLSRLTVGAWSRMRRVVVIR